MGPGIREELRSKAINTGGPEICSAEKTKAPGLIPVVDIGLLVPGREEGNTFDRDYLGIT